MFRYHKNKLLKKNGILNNQNNKKKKKKKNPPINFNFSRNLLNTSKDDEYEENYKFERFKKDLNNLGIKD